MAPTTDTTPGAHRKMENDREEEGPRGTKRKISLSNCGVCGSEEAKYRCPACLANSCSLLCVKKHKDDTGCSGVRNKTAFVTISEFDEMTLLSDYRLLEDTGRFAGGATRDKLVQVPRSTARAKRLAASARKLNITLRFLPITFTKSKENSTLFFTKDKQFLWHVKVIFPQSSTEFSQRRVLDGQTLEQILTPYIHPTESDPVTRQKLKVYVRTPFDHVKVFMKAEGRKANSVRYHELDICKTLRDNLSYKTIIEYPVLHVVLREHWKEFPLKGSADPASACKRVALQKELQDQENNRGVQVSPFLGGASETVPETEHPPVKRATREAEEGDVEEGELVDSSEEEEEEEEEGNTPCGKSTDSGNRLADELEVIAGEPEGSADGVN